MGLGTSETTRSLALAAVPPGNVVKAIAEARQSMWRGRGAVSARAWFDLPVVAWLGEPLDAADLSALAAGYRVSFSLGSPIERDGLVFLPFADGLADAIVSTRACTVPPGSGGTYTQGPFPGGIGCYCVSGSCPDIEIGAFQAKTFLLALVELEWSGPPYLRSSWRTLAAARAAGDKRRRI